MKDEQQLKNNNKYTVNMYTFMLKPFVIWQNVNQF